MKKDKKKDKAIVNAGLAGAQADTVQRFGSATSEHFKAYSGQDNEAKKALAKGLKQISESKINPQTADQNIKQQAGFSAEVKTVARENAEKHIAGGKAPKSTRTDDVAKQTTRSGQSVGGRNDQLFDIAEVDKNGIYIEGSGRQMKFVGGNPQECCTKLLEKKFDKYREADVPIEIPSDFYDEVNAELGKKIASVEKQIAKAEASGKTELAEKHREQLKRYEDTKKNLRKGKLTNDEAIEARLHPKLSTAKDVAKISHRAGIEAAQTGAAIGGGISFIQNSVAVIKGDKSAGEAAGAIVGDTAKAAGMSYVTAYTGALVKGAMQNAPSQYLQTLSKTNLPGTLVVTSLEIGKTLKKYADGDIDGTECLTELGEKGTGMLAASAGAVVGQALIPIPVVGGMVGSMVGYAMASAYYNGLVGALNDAKLAHEERLWIEAECKASIEAIRQYRIDIEITVNNYLRENIAVFSTAFTEMEIAYNLGDADGFIQGTNLITRQVGGTPLFESRSEFDELMASDDAFII